MDYISCLKCSVIMSSVLLMLLMLLRHCVCVWNGFSPISIVHRQFSNAIILLVIHFGIITRVYVAGYIVLFDLSYAFFLFISWCIQSVIMWLCGKSKWRRMTSVKWFERPTHRIAIDWFASLKSACALQRTSQLLRPRTTKKTSNNNDKAVIFVHEPSFNTFYKSIHMPQAISIGAHALLFFGE